MARQMEEFVEAAQKSVEDAGKVWDELTEEQQELAIGYMIKLYYEANPEEAKEILEGEE